ncbi:inactive poly [Dorcoceras hygrometricum]|uniref:Inactive poly n=1 Tax=Dorcoceras hygrometricum TaxID=472368 RepID=A0A2Z7C0B7_9LAMI|nr:inactive poly [Dorcoceras hygrometricum]
MRSVVASHGPGSNPMGNAICNAILLQSFPVLQIFGLQYLDCHHPPSSDVLPLDLAQKLKISKSIKTGPDIAYRPENFTGCPGQARTKTLEEIRPAVTTSPETRRSGGRPAAAPPPRKCGSGARRRTQERATSGAKLAQLVRTIADQQRRFVRPSSHNDRATFVASVRPAEIVAREERRNDPSTKRANNARRKPPAVRRFKGHRPAGGASKRDCTAASGAIICAEEWHASARCCWRLRG